LWGFNNDYSTEYVIYGLMVVLLGNELKGMSKGELVDYFKLLNHNLRGGTGENCKNFHQGSSFWVEICA
jgi:hypothetical protein